MKIDINGQTFYTSFLYILVTFLTPLHLLEFVIVRFQQLFFSKPTTMAIAIDTSTKNNRRQIGELFCITYFYDR